MLHFFVRSLLCLFTTRRRVASLAALVIGSLPLPLLRDVSLSLSLSPLLRLLLYDDPNTNKFTFYVLLHLCLPGTLNKRSNGQSLASLLDLPSFLRCRIAALASFRATISWYLLHPVLCSAPPSLCLVTRIPHRLRNLPRLKPLFTHVQGPLWCTLQNMHKTIHNLPLATRRRNAHKENRNMPNLRQTQKRLPDLRVGSGIRTSRAGQRHAGRNPRRDPEIGR